MNYGPGPRLPYERRLSIPSSTAKYVWDRDNSICVYCGAKGEELDHVYPHVSGGQNDRMNLVVS